MKYSILALVTIVTVVSISSFLSGAFSEPHHNKIRIFFFFCIALTSTIPGIISEFFYDPKYMLKFDTRTYIILVSFLMSGGIFLASFFPERCYPKTFDFIGNSHNLAHVLVVIGSLGLVKITFDMYEQNKTF